MALPSPPPLFAVFRRELQLFEILQPVPTKDGSSIQRLVYGAPAHVPVWTVAHGLDHLTGTTHTFTIKEKPVDYTYTGTVLVADNYSQPIPIVHFSKTRYFPSALQGVRVIYSDGIQSAYFFKPAHWALQPKPVLEKPAITQENTLQVVNRQPLINEEEEAPEELDPLKVGSCLSILFLFFLTAYLSSRKVEHAFVPDLDPYNPFENTCTVDDSTFFQDRFTVYYP